MRVVRMMHVHLRKLLLMQLLVTLRVIARRSFVKIWIHGESAAWKTRRSIAYMNVSIFVHAAVAAPTNVVIDYSSRAALCCIFHRRSHKNALDTPRWKIQLLLAASLSLFHRPFNTIRSKIVPLNLIQVGRFNKFNSYRDSSEILLSCEIF